jgi:hypothetical protein
MADSTPARLGWHKGGEGDRRAGEHAVDVDLAYGQHRDRSPTQRLRADGEAAMATFARSWRRQ